MHHSIWCILMLPISCSYILTHARMWLEHPGAWIHHIIPSSNGIVCVYPFTTSTIVLRSSGPYRSTPMYFMMLESCSGTWYFTTLYHASAYCFLLASVMPQWFDLQWHYECSRPEVLPPSFTYIDIYVIWIVLVCLYHTTEVTKAWTRQWPMAQMAQAWPGHWKYLKKWKLRNIFKKSQIGQNLA